MTNSAVLWVADRDNIVRSFWMVGLWIFETWDFENDSSSDWSWLVKNMISCLTCFDTHNLIQAQDLETLPRIDMNVWMNKIQAISLFVAQIDIGKWETEIE